MNLFDKFLWWLDNVQYQIEQNFPNQCMICNKWFRYKELNSIIHHVAGQVLICQKCYDELHLIKRN
jgi:hypothetical protein